MNATLESLDVRNLDAAALQALLGKLAATYGHADVLRCLATDLRDVSAAHESDADDYDDCDDEEDAPDWAQAERDCSAVMSDQADALDQAADAIADAKIDRARALGLA